MVSFGKWYSLLVLVVLVALSFILICCAEGEERMLDRKVNIFKIEDGTMREAVRKLASKHKLPICLETEFIDTSKGETEKRLISLYLKNKTIRQILEALVKQDNRYCWQEDFKNEIINVIPCEVKDNKAYPLNRRISRFSLKDKNEGEIISELAKQARIKADDFSLAYGGTLTPEFMDALDNTRMTISLRDVTVREILNAIARKKGNCNWVYIRLPKHSNLSFIPR